MRHAAWQTVRIEGEMMPNDQLGEAVDKNLDKEEEGSSGRLLSFGVSA